MTLWFHKAKYHFFFFKRVSTYASTPDNSSLSLEQDINQFLV